MFFFSKLREIIWGKPAATKAERRLVVKLDIVILSFCCLMYWVNYLDRMNLNNAYVSGMKEDLKFHGKQLNVINTSKFQPPHRLISMLTSQSLLRWLCPRTDPQQPCTAKAAASHLLPELCHYLGTDHPGDWLHPSPIPNHGLEILPSHVRGVDLRGLPLHPR